MSYFNADHNLIKNLSENGFCELEKINEDFREEVLLDIEQEISNKTYSANSKIGYKVAEKLGFSIEKMSDLHYEVYKSKPKYLDFYPVLRVVKPGQSVEALRVHYDSHRFTIVIPLQTPYKLEHESGELLIFPNLRSEPINSLTNFFGKLFSKIFTYKPLLDILMARKKFNVFNFNNGKPIIFQGRRTLHGNYRFSDQVQSPRITLLLHFFDPEGPSGFGATLRSFRKKFTR